MDIPASDPDRRGPLAVSPSPSATIDERHGAAIEAACDLDRGYAARHPEATTYLRPALQHELCVPGEPCRDHALVRVLFVAPGLRARTAVG